MGKFGKSQLVKRVEDTRFLTGQAGSVDEFVSGGALLACIFPDPLHVASPHEGGGFGKALTRLVAKADKTGFAPCKAADTENGLLRAGAVFLHRKYSMRRGSCEPGARHRQPNGHERLRRGGDRRDHHRDPGRPSGMRRAAGKHAVHPKPGPGHAAPWY